MKHYNRWQYNGDPLKGRFMAKTFAEALAHYAKPQGDCLVWTGFCNADGYGTTRYNGPTIGAHRAAWLHANGAIPGGMEVDHICHVRNCVKVSHLRLATRLEQMNNMSGPYRSNTTGYKGVTRSGDKFIARNQHNNVRVYLGKFDTPELAHEAIVKHTEEAI